MIDVVFHAMTLVVLPFWLPMIFAPRASWTRRLVSSPWIILPPVLVYAGLVATHLPALLAAIAPASPASLAEATGTLWGATLFWTYAGAFDLFVGRWIYLDAAERGIGARWTSPALAVAILYGPIGFLLYAVARGAHAGRGSVVA